MNFKGIIQYEGTRYHGWQKQKNTQNTIQQKVEDVLSRMVDCPVEVLASGRTDAGVHAWEQVFHVHLDTAHDGTCIREYLNTYLPSDIRVLAMEPTQPRFHSRLQAVGKTYCYRMNLGRIAPVFDRDYVWHLPGELDLKAMESGAALLEGEHDFAPFSSVGKTRKSTIRLIREIQIQKQGDRIALYFTGNGFLYNMVRLLTGTLVEIGQHKKEPEDILRIFATGSRQEAGFMAPAKGLMLMKVYYEESEFQSKKGLDVF